MSLKKFSTFTLTLAMFATSANAFSSVEIPRKMHFSNLHKISDNTLKIKVEVENSANEKTTTWELSPGDKAVFFSKFKALGKAVEAYSPLDIPVKSDTYLGLRMIITDKYGNKLLPFYVFDGRVTDERFNFMAIDPMRNLEYWLWSTGAPNNLTEVVDTLPIIDFKQCAALGHTIVETTPRQCLLANGNIFLDVLESPTQEALHINNFDDCLQNGQALINTFPRRCIAAGGHVFTEPPRLRQVAPQQAADGLRAEEFTLEDFN